MDKRNLEITDAQGGAAFNVRVVTRAEQAEVAGVGDDGLLKVRLTAPSAEEANEELVAFLAEALEVEPNKVEIVAGHSSRDKIVSVQDVLPEVLEERLMSIKDE
jgi:uncharacterized protein (TIGR00251 family)